MQFPLRKIFFYYYRPHKSVSEVDGSEFFDQESLMSLKKRNLALKVIEMMMMNPLMIIIYLSVYFEPFVV